MSWQSFLGNAGTANWIALIFFHSLWLSLAAFLINHIRKLKAPVVRSTWCTFLLLLLFALPLITWLVPRTVVPLRPEQEVRLTSVPMADSKPSFLSGVLGVKSLLPQARIKQWTMLMNQFGLLWLAVTLGSLGRLLYGLAFLKGYCHGLQEVANDRLSSMLRETSKYFGFRKKPRVFVSPQLPSPISIGIQAPLVILPSSLYQHVGDGELRAILLHEFAHIYHYDHVLGLLQRFIKALYWWNPLVYRLCNTLSVAREEVSDNYAISGMESAESYANLLVSLVEKTSLISRMPCAAGMATPYESLETRIKNIVSKERDMRVKANNKVISLVATATVLLCGLVSVGSQFDVFGIEQELPAVAAKPVIVYITGADANYMNAFNGSVLVLESSSDKKYQSSPIAVTGKTGDCEFREPILPGKYKLIVDILGLKVQLDIPPTNNKAAALDMNFTPKGISIRVRDSDNSEVR
jgi:beta-lactamase regulating signal transducer with metallopeptidase domain